MNLPIDVVPGSRPLKFKWRNTMDSLVGMRSVDYEGALPANVEVAIKELVDITKRLITDNENLKKQVAAQADTKKPESPSRKPKG